MNERATWHDVYKMSYYYTNGEVKERFLAFATAPGFGPGIIKPTNNSHGIRAIEVEYVNRVLACNPENAIRQIAMIEQCSVVAQCPVEAGMTLNIDERRSRVVTTAAGALQQAEITACITEYLAQRAHLSFDTLGDYTKVTRMNAVTSEYLHTLAHQLASYDKPQSAARTALIAGEPAVYNVLREFAAARTALPNCTKRVEAFRTISDGLAFLDVCKTARSWLLCSLALPVANALFPLLELCTS